MAEYGFRLPSALDNRPLTFPDWLSQQTSQSAPAFRTGLPVTSPARCFTPASHRHVGRWLTPAGHGAARRNLRVSLPWDTWRGGQHRWEILVDECPDPDIYFLFLRRRDSDQERRGGGERQPDALGSRCRLGLPPLSVRP